MVVSVCVWVLRGHASVRQWLYGMSWGSDRMVPFIVHVWACTHKSAPVSLLFVFLQTVTGAVSTVGKGVTTVGKVRGGAVTAVINAFKQCCCVLLKRV